MTLEVDTEDDVQCHCDRVRAEQIIWNLISNALKFTPKGGDVRIALVKEAGFVKMSATDTGQGIAAEHIRSVFDMFNQADIQATPGNGGLGIGLALAKQLVVERGGRVEAASAWARNSPYGCP